MSLSLVHIVTSTDRLSQLRALLVSLSHKRTDGAGLTAQPVCRMLDRPHAQEEARRRRHRPTIHASDRTSFLYTWMLLADCLASSLREKAAERI